MFRLRKGRSIINDSGHFFNSPMNIMSFWISIAGFLMLNVPIQLFIATSVFLFVLIISTLSVYLYRRSSLYRSYKEYQKNLTCRLLFSDADDLALNTYCIQLLLAAGKYKADIQNCRKYYLFPSFLYASVLLILWVRYSNYIFLFLS